MNPDGLVRYWRVRLAVWNWERQHGRYMDVAESDEWWCGVCKSAHKIGDGCPDGGVMDT